MVRPIVATAYDLDRLITRSEALENAPQVLADLSLKPIRVQAPLRPYGR